MAEARRYVYGHKDDTEEAVIDKLNETFSEHVGADKMLYLTPQGALKGQLELSPAELARGLEPATIGEVLDEAQLYVVTVAKVETTQ